MSLKQISSYMALALGSIIVGCTTMDRVPDDQYNPRIDAVLSSAQVPTLKSRPPIAANIAMNQAGSMSIHALNVGAGSCHIIECPGPENDVIVYDCGTIDRTPNDMTSADVSAYGNSIFNNTSNITVIASHPDRDHYSLIGSLLGDRVTKAIWLGGDSNKYAADNFIDWMIEQQNLNVAIFHEIPNGFANAGLPMDEISCGNASVYFLTANVGDSKNANSIAMLLYQAGFKALFPGDAEGVTQDSIMENYGALTREVDLLFGSHHGSSSHESNQGDWPDHVQPNIVIYSSGDKFKHPKCSIVGNYRQRLFDSNDHPVWCDPKDNSSNNPTTTVNFAEYITEVNGTIIVETNGQNTSVTCSRHPAGCF